MTNEEKDELLEEAWNLFYNFHATVQWIDASRLWIWKYDDLRTRTNPEQDVRLEAEHTAKIIEGLK